VKQHKMQGAGPGARCRVQGAGDMKDVLKASFLRDSIF
jgi:hypothetical protein